MYPTTTIRERTRPMPKFLASTPARVVTVCLLLQAALVYSSIRTEVVPVSRPLAGVPVDLGSWHLKQEGVVEQEVMDILKAAGESEITLEFTSPATPALIKMKGREDLVYIVMPLRAQ